MCCAGSRVYVHEAVHDEFVAKSIARARRRTVGAGLTSGAEHGPQVDKVQFDKILDYVATGEREGATLACGGTRVGDKGFFIAPAVFTGVTDGMTIAREEVFGPLMSILKFSDTEEVIRRANDTPYGLAAAVFTKSLDTALVVSSALRAGTVWVNCYNILEACLPFGGYKQSGSGRELGEYGLAQYSEVKTVTISVSSKNT